MLQFNPIIPNDIKAPPQTIISDFKKSLQAMLNSSLKNQNDEEFQKGCIKDFLRESFGYSCNTRGKVDLAIYDDEIPKVLFEVKATGNKVEFVKTPKDLNSKAFYESILYYLRESRTNNNIKHIILCTVHEFYIINAKAYHKLFVNNADKTIQKRIDTAYNNCDKKQGNDTSTAQFYKQVEAIIKDIEGQLEFCYINVESALNNQNDLALFYALLSPTVLLQIPRYIDANTLNKKFYKELLYILGLREYKEHDNKGKIIIKASDTPNTLLDSIKQAFADELPKDSSDDEIFNSYILPLITLWNNRILFLRLLESMLLSFRHIDKRFLDISILRDFGALNTLFFKVLAVKNRTDIPQNLANIPYLNSSLFEKSALESQGFEIANLDKIASLAPKLIEIPSFSVLDSDRGKSLTLLEYIFKFLHIYDFTTTQKDIKDNVKINYDKLINSAVLGLVFEKLNGYKEGSFYTPSFITRYMCKNSIRKIVVEKFQERGFKAQSPEALYNEIDINKLDEANKIFLSIRICDPAVGSGHFLVSALNELIKIKYDLGLLLDCDGKRLNDIKLEPPENDELLIKDSKGNILDYRIPAHEGIEAHRIQKAIFNAKKEIIENCLFGVDINPNSVEICKLRLWIELLKYSYYENIATKELQTLPNIDINIKCGNSLISRFDLHDSLKHIPNINKQIENYQKLVLDYKHSNQSELKVSKKDIESQIQSLKATFRLSLKDPKTKKDLERAIENHIKLYGLFMLDDESLLYGLDSGVSNTFASANLSAKEQESALESYANIMKLRKKLDFALSGAEYEGAFEWRFEFPEVLDSNGDFMGFDLIIGNPPYIKEADNKKAFENTKNLRTYQGKMDIWYHFVGKGFDLVKNQGIVTFIAQNNWTTSAGAKKLRNVILGESQILNLVDFGSYMCFDSASIQTMIMEFRKTKSIPKSYSINYSKIEAKNPTDEHRNALLKRENFKDNIYLTPIITPNKLIDNNITFTRNFQQNNLLNKIAECSNFNFTQKEIGQGICPSLDNLFILKDISSFSTKETKYIKEWHTGLPQKYYVLPTNKFLIYMSAKNYKKDNLNDLPNLQKHFEPYKDKLTKAKIQYKTPNKPYFFLHREREERFFIKGNEKIISQVRCEIPTFAYSQENFYGSRALFFLQTNRISMKYLLGVLNSKLIAFWLKYKGKIQGNLYKIEKDSLLNIPIVESNAKNQKIADKIVNLVDKVLESKAQGKDSTESESQIDDLVYKLYNLDSNEIKIIQGD